MGRSNAAPSRSKACRTAVTIVTSKSGSDELADEQFGEIEESTHLSCPDPGVGPCHIQADDHLAYDDRYHHEYAQGRPVLGRAHREGVVGRDEDVVVDEEAHGRAGRSRQ